MHAGQNLPKGKVIYSHIRIQSHRTSEKELGNKCSLDPHVFLGVVINYTLIIWATTR